MNRLGSRRTQWQSEEQLRRHPALREINPDEPFCPRRRSARNSRATTVFNNLAMSSFARSSELCGTVALSASHADWVRPGIMLYGASPFAPGGGEQLSAQQLDSAGDDLAVASLHTGVKKAGENRLCGLFRAEHPCVSDRRGG